MAKYEFYKFIQGKYCFLWNNMQALQKYIP